MADFMDDLYPYRRQLPTFRRIPEEPIDRDVLLDELTEIARREDASGDAGRVSGSLYCGDHDHYAYLGQVFTEFAHANVLQRDMYPSATKFEGEIVAMTLDLLHAQEAGPDACGVVTSGGSESLITALYAYREQARAERGITHPNVVVPVTAHVALDKGAHWMNIEMRHAPVTDDLLADVDAMAELVDDQTIAIVGSAGDYAHGLIDPISDLADLARDREIGLHVDGCLGGFLLPWAEQLGYEVPLWDFRVPGVTSISADTHKYGYALKGSSTLLYHSKDLRRHQYFTHSTWPGGFYLSPGLAGSRSGGLLASTWAALVTTGRQHYLDHAGAICSTAEAIKQVIDSTGGVRRLGNSPFVVAFAADEAGLDIYLVNDALKAAGWRMNALQRPAALHFCVTRPNTAPGTVESFAAAIAEAVSYARLNRGQPAESGAMYGLGATPGGNDTVHSLMTAVLDVMHEPAPVPTNEEGQL